MYGGELIHKEIDNYGSIEVVDFQQKLRSLHFGNKTQQSAMLLSNPFLLIHKYTQAMMLPICWHPPSRVLVLGLGSGSIVKYLYNYFQNTHIDAVELRPKVIELATDYFMLPDSGTRLQIFNQCAFDWLEENQHTEKYDLIIVDMFLTTKRGKDLTQDVSTSVKAIEQLLSKDGTAVFNHLSDNIFSYPAFDTLSSLFTHNLYSIEIDANNSLLYASRAAIPEHLPEEDLYQLESNYSLPYSQYFNRLQPVLS